MIYIREKLTHGVQSPHPRLSLQALVWHVGLWWLLWNLVSLVSEAEGSVGPLYGAGVNLVGRVQVCRIGLSTWYP